MALIEYPSELSKSFWDKKKGAVPPSSALETQLKVLEKKHGAVDWSAFDAGWEKGAKTAAALDEAHAALDRAYRSKVFALKSEAQGVADAAQKLLKDKASAKPTLDAGKSVVDAVKAYSKAIDDGMAQLEQAHAKAAAALKASTSKSSEDDDDEAAGGVLLQPKRLLTQLQMCKRMPERRVNFAFVSDGKSEPGLCLSPKTAGKQLFSKVQAESGIKTGGFGTAWVIDKTLFLQMEKPFSGIVKKMREPLKSVGFKVSKIVLAGEDGTVLEEDQEAEDSAADGGTAGATATGAAGEAAATTTPPPAPDDTQLRFTTLLRQLSPAIAAAATAGGPAAADIKARAAEAAGYGRDKLWAEGLAVLQALQAQLGTQGDAASAAAPAAPAASPRVQPGVAFTQTRLLWDQTRKKVQAELRKLETSILDACKEESDFAEIATGTKNLYELLDHLDERLIDKLDEALNAADPQARQAFNDEAREIVGEYVDFIDSEALLQDIDNNGFTSLAIKPTLTASLAAIDKRLRA